MGEGKKYDYHSSVGALLDFIEKHNIPRDARIFMQRVEDVYFEKHNWKTVNKKGEEWHNTKRWNNDIDSGKYLNKEEYPNIEEGMLFKATPEELEASKDQYYAAWSPVKYPDDNNLYIDAHY